MKFVLAGLLIKWEWGNNDRNMVVYSSFELFLQKHPDVRCLGSVFQLVLPHIQGEKEEKKTKTIIGIYRYAMYAIG